MLSLKLTQIGNSVGFVLPMEAVSRLKLEKGALPFDPIAEATKNWDGAGWVESSNGMALVTSIMRAQQLLLGRVDEALAPFGLTFARFEVLMLLSFSRRGELPLGKIGQRLQVHPASVTNAIDRLESGGLVVRVPHPHDGRTTLAASRSSPMSGST